MPLPNTKALGLDGAVKPTYSEISDEDIILSRPHAQKITTVKRLYYTTRFM
jgi:hypothetical protein